MAANNVIGLGAPDHKFLAGEYVLDEILLGKLVDDRIPGQVKFHSVLDLQDLFTTFSITQSIHNPFMKLDIALGESKQVFEHFGSKGMQGEEFVRIKFKTPTDIFATVEGIFYVTGYSPVGKDQHDLGHALVLRCVSKEKLINDISSVNRHFQGNLDEIATNIYKTDILKHEEFKALKAGFHGIGFDWSERDFKADLVDGIQSFIIPGLSPFGAMHFLTLRAFGGSDFKGSMYTFFENNNGYNFVNLENIIKQSIESNEEDIPTYTYDSQHNDSRYDKKYFRNIQTMFPLQVANTLTKIGNGAFSNRVRAIDHVKKRFFDTGFDMEEQYKEFNTTGNVFNMTSAFYDRFCDTPVDFTVIKDTADIENNTESFEHIIGKRRAYMNLLTSFGYNIVVYGDTNLNAGSVINLDLIEGGTSERKDTSIYTGYYFITDLIHTVDKGKFNTTLSIAKDSLDRTHSE